jgi:hypothetical protein
MFHLNLRALFVAFPLAFLVGCISTSTEDTHGGGGGNTVRVTLQASYEKQTLGPSGYGPVTTGPARYAYAEIRQVSNNAILASGYLGSDGTGYADVPTGSNAYARVFAAYESPATTGSSFFFRGSVVNASYFTSTPFDQTSDWYVDSSSFTANSSGTLAVKALTSNRIAGAFNIADQAVSLGLKVRDLEPTLRLPNLHTYWSTSTNPNDQTRTYPTVLTNSSGQVVKTSSGRAIFTHAVYGLQNGPAWTEQDEWDDGTLVETMAHLLFANNSYLADGSSALSLLRLDNENTFVTRYGPTEPSVGFAGGFCDFLAAAALGNPVLLDSYRNGSGAFTVDSFDLRLHSQIDPGQRTEFTRGSVAVSLWGIWQNALGGSSTSLATLWSSVRSNVALANGTGEYNGAAITSYPTFLTGLKARAGSSWSAIVSQLGAEGIPEPNDSYFGSTDLWTAVPVPSGTQTGSLRCYPASDYRFYDYAPWTPNYTQSLNYKFTLSAARSVSVTMTPLDGQDFELDVLGSAGWFAASYKTPFGLARTLSLGTLQPGTYVVRVRANPDAPTTNGTYRFNLVIN